MIVVIAGRSEKPGLELPCDFISRTRLTLCVTIETAINFQSLP